jgi:hypothetical protein
MDAAGKGNTGPAAVRGLARARLGPICRPHHVHGAITNGEDFFVGVEDFRTPEGALKWVGT